MHYTLTRSRDGAGDSGSLSESFQYEKGMQGRVNLKSDSRPIVGAALRVGSYQARTMQWQDYWTTTYVSEIIEDTPNRVVFRTENGSTYEWTCS